MRIEEMKKIAELYELCAHLSEAYLDLVKNISEGKKWGSSVVYDCEFSIDTWSENRDIPHALAIIEMIKDKEKEYEEFCKKHPNVNLVK